MWIWKQDVLIHLFNHCMPLALLFLSCETCIYCCKVLLLKALQCKQFKLFLPGTIDNRV